MELVHFTIKATAPAWGGYCAVVLGQGTQVKEALADASKLLGSPFRPKQDGRQPELLTVTIERPDGSRFNVDAEMLKMASTAEILESIKLP